MGLGGQKENPENGTLRHSWNFSIVSLAWQGVNRSIIGRRMAANWKDVFFSSSQILGLLLADTNQPQWESWTGHKDWWVWWAGQPLPRMMLRAQKLQLVGVTLYNNNIHASAQVQFTSAWRSLLLHQSSPYLLALWISSGVSSVQCTPTRAALTLWTTKTFQGSAYIHFPFKS